MKRLFVFLLILSNLLVLSNPAYSDKRPALSLAGIYSADIDLDEYWVSEKFDGVRAYWDGSQLLTRQGNVIHAPRWFYDKLPAQPLDGELWIGRGKFEQTVSTVRKKIPRNKEWAAIRYMIFDLPGSSQPFNKRLEQLRILLSDPQSPIQLIPHWKASSHVSLQQKLEQLAINNGEGFMLHRGNSVYKAGRNNDILKLKIFSDAEATVLAYTSGKGKYLGMMGSMQVKDRQGKQFSIGTGFTDLQRSNPPPIGAIITFRYNGFTANGIPRHARFLRIRTDHNL